MISFFFALISSLSVAAFTVGSTRAQSIDSSHHRAPDIELDAHVKIRELKYVNIGSPKVTLFGLPTLVDSVSITHRINLPETPEAGVTYRNVELTYHLECSLPQLEQILAKDSTLIIQQPARK